MRWWVGLLCMLVAAWAQPAILLPAIDTPDSPLKEIKSAAGAFVRAAPLPAWVDLAAPPPVPPAATHQPMVVRLSETQLRVGPTPVRLNHRAVQVNEASALDAIGQLALEFNPQFERLLLHKVLILRGAQTIDHTRTAPVRFLQREVKLEEGLYSGEITALIVLPGVRAGDTLQLVYSIVGKSPALGAHYSQRVSWEQTHAIGLRRITLVAPAARQIRWRWFGGAGGDEPQPIETVDGGLRRLRFEARNLAGASAEPLMPPRVRALRELQISEYADWNEVARWALAQFPAGAALPKEMTPLLNRLRSLSDPEEQASQALQWVQSEIRHWSIALGESAMRPQLPTVVVRRGYGDCKDKSLLLASLLRALGIDARPTLASLTTGSGPTSMLPAPDDFDHVIVQARLGGREYYLDPTRHGQTGLLSRMGQRFEGAAVLPIDAATQDLVIVQSPNRSEIFRSQIQERLSLGQFGDVGHLEVEIQWFGINAEAMRMSLQRMDVSELRQFVAAGYQQQYGNSRLLGDPQVNDDRRLNQLTISASFTVPGLARGSGDDWWVPFAPGLGDAIVVPPTLVRRFPLFVASFPVLYSYSVEMQWPDGTKLDDTPASQRLETPHFRLLTTRNVRGNIESRSLEFQAKVSEVPPNEVRILVNDVDRMAQQIGGAMTARSSDAPQVDAPDFRRDDRAPGQ